VEKCAIHVPDWVHNPNVEVRTCIEDDTGIPVSDEGIVLMGTVACRRSSTPIYPSADARALTALGHLKLAERLDAAIRQMERTALPVGASQAAWMLGQRFLPHALDYDARTCDLNLRCPLANRLDQSAETTALSLMHATEVETDENLVDTLRLPLRLGGMQ
jgi:hypothetical protein